MSENAKKILTLAGIADYRCALRSNAGEILARGTLNRTIRIDLPAGDGSRRSIFVKQLDYSRRPWRYFLRRGKARNEFAALTTLRRIGVPAPIPVAFGETRSWGRLMNAVLVVAGINNACTLLELEPQLRQMTARQRWRLVNRIIATLAETVRRAHRSGFVHMDMKWRNVLVRADDDKCEVFLIDCPRGGRRRGRRLKAGIIDDLLSLDKLAPGRLSRGRRMKFLKLYLGDSANKSKLRKPLAELHAHRRSK